MLGYLPQLEVLELDKNRLTTVNATTLKNLPSLEILKLSDNHLSELTLAHNSNLTALKLTHNNFLTFPTLGYLPQLKTLLLDFPKPTPFPLSHKHTPETTLGQFFEIRPFKSPLLWNDFFFQISTFQKTHTIERNTF